MSSRPSPAWFLLVAVASAGCCHRQPTSSTKIDSNDGAHDPCDGPEAAAGDEDRNRLARLVGDVLATDLVVPVRVLDEMLASDYVTMIGSTGGKNLKLPSDAVPLADETDADPHVARGQDVWYLFFHLAEVVDRPERAFILDVRQGTSTAGAEFNVAHMVFCVWEDAAGVHWEDHGSVVSERSRRVGAGTAFAMHRSPRSSTAKAILGN